MTRLYNVCPDPVWKPVIRDQLALRSDAQGGKARRAGQGGQGKAGVCARGASRVLALVSGEGVAAHVERVLAQAVSFSELSHFQGAPRLNLAETEI